MEDDRFGRIGAAHFAHINFRRTFKFNVATRPRRDAPFCFERSGLQKLRAEKVKASQVDALSDRFIVTAV